MISDTLSHAPSHSPCYSLSHLADHVLLRDLAALLSQERQMSAALLAHLAEVDARKLYLPAGYASMYLYCVGELKLSEDSAYKRIQAARTARQFPAVFEMLADGRLHLGAVCLLAPHLTAGNVAELLQAASHRTKSEIEQLLAQRFPRTEVFQMVQAIPASSRMSDQLAPGQVGTPEQEGRGADSTELAPGQVEPASRRARPTPVACQRFALQVTVGQATHDKLRHAQSLLAHAVPSGDISEVLDRALDALIGQLERRKFAATARPRSRRSAANGRYVPAEIRREVWQRDGGQCTFVSDRGHRCEARAFLEFDHVDPVARGGRSTADGMRLRCRAHNQYTAECAFGAGFMRRKREEARARAAEQRATAARAAAEQRAAAAQTAARDAAARAKALEVVPWLRQLGCRPIVARQAAMLCMAIPDAPLEERIRLALTGLAPAHARRKAPVVISSV